MKKVYLAGIRAEGRFAIVDDEDFLIVGELNWYFSNSGYAMRTKRIPKTRKTYNIQMHRVINKTPIGLQTDHINRNKLDNRKENLRNSNHKFNKVNSATTSQSGYRGVIKMGSCERWRAAITSDRQFIYIGCYKDKISAAKAYDKKAKELFGELATLNFN